jgi:hypothetical protein
MTEPKAARVNPLRPGATVPDPMWRCAICDGELPWWWTVEETGDPRFATVHCPTCRKRTPAVLIKRGTA